MRGRLGTTDWIRLAGRALAAGVAPGLWLFAGLLVAGVTLLRIGSAPDAVGPGLARISGIVQLAATLLLTFFLYRAAAQVRIRTPMLLPLLRFTLLFLALLAATVAAVVAAGLVLPAGARLADIWLASFVATVAISLLTLPLAPWQAALAAGDRRLGLRAARDGLAGQLGGFAGAWLAVVAPPFAIHLALTLLLDDPGSTLGGTALVGVVAVDSAASLAQLVLTVGLGVAARQQARERLRGDVPPS